METIRYIGQSYRFFFKKLASNLWSLRAVSLSLSCPPHSVCHCRLCYLCISMAGSRPTTLTVANMLLLIVFVLFNNMKPFQTIYLNTKLKLLRLTWYADCKIYFQSSECCEKNEHSKCRYLQEMNWFCSYNWSYGYSSPSGDWIFSVWWIKAWFSFRKFQFLNIWIRF